MADKRKQRTIANPTQISGKGLFSGCDSTLTLLPGQADGGIVFRRVDLDNAPEIPATIASVAQRQRRTALVNGAASVETVEHLMSAIHALGLDNLIIEIDAPEVPAMDHSALDFHKALSEAGIQQQEAETEDFVITAPVTVTEGEAMIVAAPPIGDGLDIVYDMDYSAHPAIGRQVLTFTLDKDDYGEQIAPARTFILDKEAEYLRSQGFGKHLDENELLVLGNDGPLGDNELRFPDECVRHKVCDLLGDLRLLGRPIKGRIMANRSGHALNQKLVAALLQPPATSADAKAEKTGSKASAETQSDADKQNTKETLKPQRRQRGAEATKAKAGGDDAAAPAMDIRKILRILPHRYPFLMIDRVLELIPDEKAVGVKNVTFNEPFFQGHYPGQPVMPGVLVLEAMAQLSGILLSKSLDNTNKVALLISMDRVKIRRAARPGDQLIITAESRQVRTRTGYCNCKSTIDGKLSAEAEIKFMLVDEDLT